jgi:hypothetical protein
MRWINQPGQFVRCAVVLCVFSAPLLAAGQQSQATATLHVTAHVASYFHPPHPVSPRQSSDIVVGLQIPAGPQRTESIELCQSRWRTETAICTPKPAAGGTPPGAITLVTQVFLP